MKYSDVVMRHFNNPSHVGELPDANAVGEAVNGVCLDKLKLFLRIDAGAITAAAYQVEGCVPSIAVGSWLTEHLPGMKLDDAGALTADDVEKALGGLPTTKKHAAYLAVESLQNALELFRLNSGR